MPQGQADRHTHIVKASSSNELTASPGQRKAGLMGIFPILLRLRLGAQRPKEISSVQVHRNQKDEPCPTFVCLSMFKNVFKTPWLAVSGFFLLRL